MKPKKISALGFKKYQIFVDERDRALERMLGNFRLKQTDVLRKYLKEVFNAVSKFLMMGSANLKTLDHQIHSILLPAVHELTDVTNTLRQRAYILTIVSEAEAIARIKGRGVYEARNQKAKDYTSKTESMAGGLVYERVALFLDRLRRDVIDRVQLGITKKDSPMAIYKGALRALPSLKRQRVVRELSKIKESDKKPDDPLDNTPDPEDVELTTGFVDSATWDQIVEDYTDDYIPEWRGPEYQIDPNEPGWPDDEKVYATDIEREMTEDFVKSVRDGQVEAANQNGIDDFVWLAIIDDKTDDCCLERDGLLTSEIEAKMESGEIDDEDCDASTPPGHINCRCRLAPAIDSEQEPATVDTGGFEDWANG